MAKKSSIASYNATIKAIRQSTGVSRREAQQAYRTASVVLGHAPSKADVKTKAVRESAASAGKQLAAAQRAKEKYVRESIERAKAPRPPRGAAGPGGRGGPRGGAGGGGGGAPGPGGGGGRRHEPPDYDFGYFDDDIPTDMYGDDDDSPGGGK